MKVRVLLPLLLSPLPQPAGAQDAEAVVPVADGGAAPVAGRRPALMGAVGPRTAAEDAHGALGRPWRVLPGALLVVVLAVPVGAPFPGVAVHVEKAPGVGRERAHLGRPLPIGPLGALAVGPGAIEVGLGGGERGAE